MAYVKVTHDLANRLEDYNYLLDKVAAIMEDGARQTIRGSAVRFARQAAKYSPPDAGRQTIRKENLARSSRSMVNLLDPNDWKSRETQHYFRIKRYVNKTPYGVFNGRRNRWNWYGSLQEAQDRMLIPARGAGRYGWLQALPVLGESVKAVVPASSKYAGLAGKFTSQGKIGTTAIEETEHRLTITVTNATTAYSNDYPLEYAAAKALSLVNMGLKKMVKRIEQDMEGVPF